MRVCVCVYICMTTYVCIHDTKRGARVRVCTFWHLYTAVAVVTIARTCRCGHSEPMTWLGRRVPRVRESPLIDTLRPLSERGHAYCAKNVRDTTRYAVYNARYRVTANGQWSGDHRTCSRAFTLPRDRCPRRRRRDRETEQRVGESIIIVLVASTGAHLMKSKRGGQNAI